MSYKRREAAGHTRVATETALLEPCACLPLSLSQQTPLVEDALDSFHITPASQELRATILHHLHNSFPREAPLSLLLLHISQLEHIHIAPQSAVLHKRQRLHAHESVLEQVLVNVQRAIRRHDQLFIHNGVGAALIFPHVDQQGMYGILERIYQSVNLLQAETLIPPLKRETDILMGIATYPEPDTSLEQVLCHACSTTRRITLRPAIMTQLWSVKDAQFAKEQPPVRVVELEENIPARKKSGTVPFMKLPAKLPPRLKQLLPHRHAVELRCAPVGRDHHCLTVAMADPTDSSAVRQLREITGMTIFPVACNVSALDALLTDSW